MFTMQATAAVYEAGNLGDKALYWWAMEFYALNPIQRIGLTHFHPPQRAVAKSYSRDYSGGKHKRTVLGIITDRYGSERRNAPRTEPAIISFVHCGEETGANQSLQYIKLR